jgi:hypothetical protein
MSARIRMLLLILIAVALVMIVVGVVSGETGAAEKIVLAAVGALLLWAAVALRRRAV